MPDLKRIRLFVVDDTPDDVRSYERLLRRSQSEVKYEIRSFDYGRAVLVALGHDEPPDCILLDFNLPDMTGLEVLESLQRQDLSHIPVIMVTGLGDEETAVQALKLGARDYLMKTVDLYYRMHRSIQAAISAARLEREITERQNDLRNFADILAHDLRSPIASIYTYIDLIDTVHGHEIPDQVRDKLGNMRTSAKVALDLIENLYQFTSRSRDGLPSEPIDLNTVLGDVIQSLHVDIEQSNTEIFSESLPVVSGIATDLAQVFSNLFRNAMKFNDSGAPTVHVTFEAHDGYHHIFVEDNGIGIAPEKAETIFEPLSRAHGDSFEGSGLGLAICRRSMRRQGGEIRCRPAAKGGTVFEVIVPAAD